MFFVACYKRAINRRSISRKPRRVTGFSSTRGIAPFKRFRDLGLSCSPIEALQMVIYGGADRRRGHSYGGPGPLQKCAPLARAISTWCCISLRKVSFSRKLLRPLSYTVRSSATPVQLLHDDFLFEPTSTCIGQGTEGGPPRGTSASSSNWSTRRKKKWRKALELMGPRAKDATTRYGLSRVKLASGPLGRARLRPET